MKNKPLIPEVCLMLLLVCTLCSCNHQLFLQKSESYLPYYGDTEEFTYEHILKPDDKVTLSVWEHQNLGVGSIYSTQNSAEEFGKWLLIDSEGEVSIPQLGRVELAGLTIREANLYLEKLYSKLIQNPIVNLRIVNAKVTVLGEVNTPGYYDLEKERVNIIELIGKAGGMTAFADIEKVRIIRGDLKNPQELYFDLTDLQTFQENDAWIIANDIVYVEAKKGKEFSRVAGKITPWVTILAGTAAILSIFVK